MPTKNITPVRKTFAAEFLPDLLLEDNKVRRGKSLILAGSQEFPGAGVLAARGAMRAGSGYVILAHRDLAITAEENPEFLFRDLNHYNWQDLKFDAVLLGPGFGVNSFTASIIEDLKKLNFSKVILDADALTVCAQEKLFPLPSTWIVTPHCGELSRCLGVSSQLIDDDRNLYIEKAHELFQCTVLLKGRHSLIRSEEGLFKNMSGNSGLAKSGTGDVLAGIVTGFRAQGLTPSQALVLGTYVHGACANLWQARGNDPLSLVASDVVDLLPRVLHRLRCIKKSMT